jgi:hypothetical protein
MDTVGPTLSYFQDEWYRVVTGAGSYSPQVASSGGEWDGAIAAFKAAN